MVCCCMPCFHKLQRKFDPVPGSGPFTLCFSETIRWICIVVPLYLSGWRYAALIEREMDAAFWGILTGCILGFSLLIYLPLKVIALRYRIRNNSLKDYRWRPSIVTYILICALPCLTMILVGIETTLNKEDCQDPCTLDSTTTTVLQVTVLGLTITEWMSKIREEHITYDLITAMALDFFFAYDCIQFIMMCTYDEEIYTSGWVYVCFIFAFVAMFRYIPAQPVGVQDKGSSMGAAICIIVSMVTVDIPFVIVRLTTMIEFGLVVSDIIHPLKNFAMICFGCTQLYIIYDTRHKMAKLRKSQENLSQSIKRRSKHPGIWDLERADQCVKTINGTTVNVCECDENNDGDKPNNDVKWAEDKQGYDNHTADVKSSPTSLKKRKDVKEEIELSDIED